MFDPIATKQDIIDRDNEDLLFVIWDENNSGLYDETSIAKNLGDATSKIYSYTGDRYDVPIVDVTALELLNPCAVDIAIYLGCTESTITELRTDRYKDCIKYLEKIASGKISLRIEKPPAGKSGAAFSAQKRRYNRDMGC